MSESGGARQQLQDTNGMRKAHKDQILEKLRKSIEIVESIECLSTPCGKCVRLDKSAGQFNMCRLHGGPMPQDFMLTGCEDGALDEWDDDIPF